MSITGKNALSIRKKDVKESKVLAQGFTKLMFAHKASAGDSVINLGSLTTPTEMSGLGFTNPSPARLTEAKLFQFKHNLTLVSSLRGHLMQDLSYRVNSNSSIKLEFEAEDGEIFTGIIDANPVSGIQVIDAKQAIVKGDLADGNTDFAIGFTTSTQSEEIVVVRNGLVQVRNTNNSSTVEDGNYYVVDTGSGYGNLIRFNDAASGSDDSILVAALGGIVESPTNSTWDELEKVQGQIDAIVPTLAALAGVPETDFQAAPNNVDLRQFGDRVVGLEEPGSPGTPKLATVSTDGAVKKNRVQTKILGANVTSDGPIADLTFNNLVPGRWYKLSGQIYWDNTTVVSDFAVISFSCGSSVVGRCLYGTGTSSVESGTQGVSLVFQAGDTSLDVSVASLTQLEVRGTGTRNFTFLTLEERNDLEETTAFT